MTYVANNDIILAAAIAGITAGVYQTIFGLCKAAFEGKGDVASVVSAVYSQTAQGIYAQALVTIGQQPSS